ncbi:MAG TPA: hypothetical protein VGE74_04645, partial [Gemmata sp.]
MRQTVVSGALGRFRGVPSGDPGRTHAVVSLAPRIGAVARALRIREARPERKGRVRGSRSRVAAEPGAAPDREICVVF